MSTPLSFQPLWERFASDLPWVLAGEPPPTCLNPEVLA